MIAHPTAQELVEAVAAWLDNPGSGADDYGRRVARNALAIVARELDQGPEMSAAAQARMVALLGRTGDAATLNAALAEAIRSGSLADDNPALMDHLKRTTLDVLAIDQPRYRHALSSAPKA